MIGRRVNSVEEITEPGDYYLNPHGTEGQDDRSLWFRLPKDDPERVADGLDNPLNRITEPPWTFGECADGSIEVRASILVYDRHLQPFWHGFLDEGHVWREC